MLITCICVVHINSNEKQDKILRLIVDTWSQDQILLDLEQMVV